MMKEFEDERNSRNNKFIQMFNELGINISLEDVKKYIPSKELILYTKNKREELYEEAMYKYYSTRKDFKDILKNFSNISQDIKDYFCNLIRMEKICITGCGGYNDKGDFISILFYTIRKNEFGKLFYAFMHELGHALCLRHPTEVGCYSECVMQSIGSGYSDTTVNEHDWNNLIEKWGYS